MKALPAALTAAAVMAAATTATAATSISFSAPGGAEQIYLNAYAPGATTVDAAVHALLDISLTSVSNSGYTWNFAYSLQNTSTALATLSTLGFSVDPNLSLVSGVSGLFGQSSTGGQLSSLGTMEVCLKSNGGQGCSGGGGGGLLAGQNGAGAFSLSFAQTSTYFTTDQVPVYNNKGKLIRVDTVQVAHTQEIAAPNQITLDGFGVHWQALLDGSSTVGVASSAPPALIDPPTDLSTIPVPVPEPKSWTMMIFGFGSIGAFLRRRRAMLAA